MTPRRDPSATARSMAWQTARRALVDAEYAATLTSQQRVMAWRIMRNRAVVPGFSQNPDTPKDAA